MRKIESAPFRIRIEGEPIPVSTRPSIAIRRTSCGTTVSGRLKSKTEFRSVDERSIFLSPHITGEEAESGEASRAFRSPSAAEETRSGLEMLVCSARTLPSNLGEEESVALHADESMRSGLVSERPAERRGKTARRDR